MMTMQFLILKSYMEKVKNLFFIAFENSNDCNENDNEESIQHSNILTSESKQSS